MDASGVEVLRPLLPEMVFGPFQDVAPTSIKAVLVLQDPYPLGDRVLASRLNRRSDADLRREWGDGYLARFVTQPWPEGKAPRGGPPRKIAEVPHAMGRALAYPAGIDRPPASFDGLRRLYEAASGSPPSRMAPELREWAAQGVLLINSCPVLYRHAGEDECASSAHQNIWTALTSRLLGWVASRNPCAAYVLFGRSAQGYERAIKTANSHAFVIKRTHPSPRAGEPRGENPFLLLGAYYAELAAQKHISAPVAW
jgi:uracil DNA glycosylase